MLFIFIIYILSKVEMYNNFNEKELLFYLHIERRKQSEKIIFRSRKIFEIQIFKW